MDIIWKLSIRQLKRKKKRTFSILFGITSASFFLTIAVIFIDSIVRKMSELDMVAEELQKFVVGAGVLLAVILASLTLFIYHVLNVSASEKIRQLGILGSVGATPFQRVKLMLFETLFLSVIGLPAGLILGMITSKLIFSFTVIISLKTLLLLLGFEVLVILLTGFIHVGSSMRGNVIQLLRNKTEKRKLTKNWKAPKWITKLFGIEGELAAKNIYFFRRRYGMIVVSFMASMVLFLDGFIYLNYMDGNYEPKDPVTKQYADIVLEKNGQKTAEESWKPFIEEVSKLEEVEEAVMMQEVKLGDVLFNGTEIKEDLNTFTAFSLNATYENPVVLNSNMSNEQKGYYMGVTLIGIDDAAFSRYLKQLNLTEKNNAIQKEIPVIIHDMVFTKKGNDTKYRQLLDLKNGEIFSVLASRNGETYGADYSVNQIEEFSEYSFQTVAVTDKLPSCYNINTDQMRYPNELLFFTPQSYLDKFLQTHKTPEITETWNHLQGWENCDGWSTTKFLCLDVKNSVKLPQQIISSQIIATDNSWRKVYQLNSEYRNTKKSEELYHLLEQYHEQLAIATDKITETGEEHGFVNPYSIDLYAENSDTKMDYYINHYSAWISIALSDPQPVIRHLFTYTLLIFIIIIAVFQTIKMILSSINSRRREFAVLLSLGTEPKYIKKMVCMESIFCLVFSYIIGSVLSIAIGFYMFHHWTKMQAIEIQFPYTVLIWEFLFLLFLILLMLYISVKCVRKIEIADLLKDDIA